MDKRVLNKGKNRVVTFKNLKRYYIHMGNKKKIQVNISPEAHDEIEQLRRKLNLGSISDVIRSSLKLAKYLELEKEAGNDVIIRNKESKKEKEVVFGNVVFG